MKKLWYTIGTKSKKFPILKPNYKLLRKNIFSENWNVWSGSIHICILKYVWGITNQAKTYSLLVCLSWKPYNLSTITILSIKFYTHFRNSWTDGYLLFFFEGWTEIESVNNPSINLFQQKLSWSYFLIWDSTFQNAFKHNSIKKLHKQIEWNQKL